MPTSPWSPEKVAFSFGAQQGPPPAPAEPEEEKPSLLRRLATPALAAAAGVGTYAAMRKFRPSAVPELRALQEQAKDKTFEVATSNPHGRGLRSMLFGAQDIPHRPNGPQVPGVSRPNSTVLSHTPDTAAPQGAVNINNGQLPGALDDKYLFSRLMTEGTGGAQGPAGSTPRTSLLRDMLERSRDPSKLRESFGSDFVIKPRTGSMSKAENLITHKTDPNDPRLREAMRNPGEFIIQEHIPIQEEFRVHTVNNVPFTASHRQMPHEGLRGLWNKYMGGGGGAFVPAMGEERDKLMNFVRDSTKHLGDTGDGGNLLGRSENLHHALDVAKLPDGSFKLIESNPTPGTLMNPIVSRKLQHAVTGRVPKDVAAGAGLLAAGAAGVGTNALLNQDEEKEDKPKPPFSAQKIAFVEDGIPSQTTPPEQAASIDPRTQGRFDELRKGLNTHGVLAGTAHKRLLIPKDKFTEHDINSMGFVPVSIAIPEAGQDRFQSFRHPDMNYHIHSHDDGWTMHEDQHAASTMLARKAEGAVNKTKAMVSGLPHVNEEGIPGMYYYLRGVLGGHKSTAARVKAEMSPEAHAWMSGLSSSHTHVPEEPKTAMPFLHRVEKKIDNMTAPEPVSAEQAARAASQLDQIEQNKPGLGELGAGAAIGGMAGLGSSALSALISGREMFEPATQGGQMISGSRFAGKLRAAGAAAIPGIALGFATPVVQNAVKTHMNESKLRDFIDQHRQQLAEEGKTAASPWGALRKAQEVGTTFKTPKAGPSIGAQFKSVRGPGTGNLSKLTTNTTGT